MKFKIGDKVFTPLGRGIIEEIDEESAYVTYSNDCGGGYLPFDFDELVLLSKGEAEKWGL